MVKVKNKKRNLAEATSQKRTQQKKKTLNPFEIHINKEKHKVLGRKTKADHGLPGVARTKAINKRKNTLLYEYKVRDKNNTFVDRRIGERNSAMTREDKIMARFAAERMKAHKKKSIFNLNDDEVLTHGGQTLADIEKFEDPRSDDEEYSDDENKTGKLDKNFVGEAHFGGGVLSKSSSTLSRKELIEQLIAESKKRKAEKQKTREETSDLTSKLDSEWKDLLPIVSASKKRTDDPVETPKADDYDIALRQLKFEARGTPSDRLKSEEEIAKEERDKLEELEADRLARMKGNLAKSSNEIKHKSADDLDDGFCIEDVNEETLTYGDDGLPKISSQSEEADSSTGQRENKDESEVDDETNESIEDDESVYDDETETMYSLKKKIDLQKEADIETSFQVDSSKPAKSKDPYDNIPVLKISDDTDDVSSKHNASKKISNGIAKQSTAHTDTVRSEKGKPKQLPRHEQDSQDDNSDVESEESGEENSNRDSTDDDNLSDLKDSDTSSDECDAPVKKRINFSEKLVQVSSQSTASNLLPVKSILKVDKDVRCEVIKQSAENREAEIRADLLRRKEVMEKARQELPYMYEAPESYEDLEKLLQNQSPDYQSVIVERIIKCNHQSLGENNKEKLSNLFQYLLEHVNSYAIADGEQHTTNCFEIIDRLCPHLYDLAHVNPLNARTCIQAMLKEKHEKFELKKKIYPGLDTLIIFKLVSLLFPTSDFRHPVVTPALVFMSQILLRCRIRNRRDVSRGLFICTLILEYTLLSKRFTPSAINFLRGVIHMATPKSPIRIIRTIPPFETTAKLSNALILDKDQSDQKLDIHSRLMMAADLVIEEIDENFKVRAFVTACNLISEFENQLEELEAVHAIFEPLIKLLDIIELTNYPENVKHHVKGIWEKLRDLEDKKLEYMIREKKKPKLLKMYEPRIETVYDGKKHKPMSKEKAEREKLLHKYKREFKGAVREIRRDRSFLAKVQIKQQIKSDEERKRKVKEIFGDASVQQGELNKIKRSK